jgi:ABC-type uncharacterized transport system YnjBCD ATPase subunit
MANQLFLEYYMEKKPTYGNISLDPNTIFGYIPQIIKDFENLSGGQRFNAAMTKALALQPDFLLLDEPTNHLDNFLISKTRSGMVINHANSLHISIHYCCAHKLKSFFL